jgi:glyoxylase-like metal-dependent hydrolase (beta-lactamase superfamily II)
MGKIQILQVQYGDAIIIECGRGDKKGIIVVDGGPTTSSDYFLEAISELPTIDLMVLTHYDEDHIGGILSLVYDCLDK